ncbi:hypothetical protein Esi_1853_0001 [Ectocarpus siliculosus]|uniref:Uncharacterized protein n=1 Tax=Ectocarpus siliculosus TaxID=2880 RepID=D7FP58_ECTSI|nr:hypothetical protein Esi_1853_0001 [Ectocarpus siliculosus]|eukprot:CBJ34274.1 hypothetical protein Esi_1853_0001 [Ectocarpus siliculosus]
MYHEGGIILLLQIICMVSTVIIYGWIRDLFKRGRDSDAQVGESARTTEEFKMDLEASSADGCVAYEVKRGRVPTAQLLAQEAELAQKSGAEKVKVITSGPTSMVDGVLASAREVDWKLFDTEVFSFEF